jgi:hypothetical protein
MRLTEVFLRLIEGVVEGVIILGIVAIAALVLAG